MLIDFVVVLIKFVLRTCNNKPRQFNTFVCMFITFWTKKIVDFNVNGVLCYFPLLVVLQGNVRMFGRIVDKVKVEVNARMEDFLVEAFEKFYVTIFLI